MNDAKYSVFKDCPNNCLLIIENQIYVCAYYTKVILLGRYHYHAKVNTIFPKLTTDFNRILD